MDQPSRREFLKHVPPLLAFAFSPPTIATGAPPQGPHLVFPSEPRERLAVTSYPFRRLIESPTNRERDPKQPGMDLKDFAQMIATKFGIQNINPLADHFASTEPSYLESFRRAVEAAGSHMVDLGLSGRKFWDPDPAQRQAALDYGKRWIDIAVVVGSPSVRQHLAGSRGVKPDVDLGAQTLAKLADYGANKNILVLLENDSPVNEDPFLIVNLIEKVRNPNLRALPDFGNSLQGGDADFNERGVTAMFQHAYSMCHVKDAVVGAGGEVYKVDLAKMFGIAKGSGYHGYFSMEFETRLADPFTGTARLMDETLKYLAPAAQVRGAP
jgi:sugar phosphate isomerase/epimerase